MAWPNSVTGPLHYYNSPMIYLERSAALLEGRFALPPCRLRPPVEDLAFGATHFRGHFCVHCRYGPVTRRLPEGRRCR